jgi:hypothetical protein
MRRYTYSTLPLPFPCPPSERNGQTGATGPTGIAGLQGATGPTGTVVVFAPTSITQNIYVNKGGSDSTGDGSITNPYATILFAMSTILDASPTKRYAINVGPGDYPNAFAFKANVFIIGTSVQDTTVSGIVSISHASWTAPGDNRSGYQNLSLLVSGSLSVDFNAVSSVEGKFSFYMCLMTVTPTFVAFSSLNQVLFQACEIVNGFIQTGIDLRLIASSIGNGASITVNSSNLSNTKISAYGSGSQGGNVSMFHSAPHSPIDALFSSFTLSGALSTVGSVNLTVSASSLPSFRILSPSTVVTYINDATALAYAPFVPANWIVPVPSVLQDAIDALAAMKIKQNLAANSNAGQFTLSAGVATIPNTLLTANSKIMMTAQTSSSNAGELSVAGIIPGVSFSVASSNILDTRTVFYQIWETY